MTITRQVFMLAVVLVTHATWSRLSAADDRPDVAATPVPNAAVIYWQAFSELPELLAETEKEVYEAAAANPNALESAELKPIVARFEPALHDLHRAVRVPVCDWNLDYDAGPECRLPHIQSARALAKAALVRANSEATSRGGGTGSTGGGGAREPDIHQAPTSSDTAIAAASRRPSDRVRGNVASGRLAFVRASHR